MQELKNAVKEQEADRRAIIGLSWGPAGVPY